jgi:predicted DNA binding CopG/RHH family protein
MARPRPRRSPVASPEAIAEFLKREPDRVAISIRLDRRVMHAIREEAGRQGIGYQTLIHNVLTSAAITFGGVR